MVKLGVAFCTACVLAALSSVAWATEPTAGTLSVESGKGVVMIDVRGSVLGRLTSGSLRVTDHTPNDRFGALVVGRKVTQERVGPRTVLYRGQGLRFRLLGGRFRMVARGSGITISAVGRGVVMLDGDPRFPGDDVGIYSRDGVDCGTDPENCVPLPSIGERFALEPSSDEPSPKAAP
jgi:hypothetical protein